MSGFPEAIKAKVLEAIHADLSWHQVHPAGGCVTHAEVLAEIATAGAFEAMGHQVVLREARIKEMEADLADLLAAADL